MTGPEHIVAWIESSQPEYRRLMHISIPGNFISDCHRAQAALDLAKSAYKQMVDCGDAFRHDHDASTILDAALALVNWRIEQ